MLELSGSRIVIEFQLYKALRNAVSTDILLCSVSIGRDRANQREIFNIGPVMMPIRSSPI